MQPRICRGRRGGFTLIEVIIAIAILGIVVMIGVSNFQGMMEKYRVEGETKQMFADLMDARARAMQRNRGFIVQINSSGIDSKDYKTYEDTNPAATDGNGLLEPTLDKLVASATMTDVIVTDNIASLPLTFNFDRNRIASVTGFTRFDSTTVRPDYDCITVKATRIKMGRYNGTNDCIEK